MSDEFDNNKSKHPRFDLKKLSKYFKMVMFQNIKERGESEDKTSHYEMRYCK